MVVEINKQTKTFENEESVIEFAEKLGRNNNIVITFDIESGQKSIQIYNRDCTELLYCIEFVDKNIIEGVC
jgi:hypothetical protein